MAARGARPGADRAHRDRDRPARRRRGRRPSPVCAGVGLLHAMPVGRIRHGALRARALLGAVAREPRADRGGHRPATDRTIHDLDDVHAAIEHYVESIPYGEILSTATHISTDIDYRPVSDGEMAAALAEARSGRPGGARLLCVLRQRGVPDRPGSPRRGDRLPVQLRCRAAAVRDGQPAVAADDRPGRRP